MNFRTPIPTKVSPLAISYQTPILSIGSCFATNIGERLAGHKFPVCLNPFGIIYNPISIQQSLERLLTGDLYTKKDLVQNQGIWYNFDFHGHFSSPDPQQALALMNASLAEGKAYLKTAKFIIITLGTSKVFIHESENNVVANCHKFPTKAFRQKRLSPSEIQLALVAILQQVHQFNKELQVILTVSPIRHIKDGLVENQRSKAALLLAVEQVVTLVPIAHYFPAYELMLDDLRDYRFYEKDMIHPNQQAIDYIWGFFKATYLKAPTIQILEQVRKIIQSSQHRPFHPKTSAHQAFLNKQLDYIKSLRKEYPYLDFQKEEEMFREQLL